MSKRPLIGCGTYHKVIDQNPPIEVYGLMPSYVKAVLAAGGVPLLIPLGLNQEALQAIFERIDGLLLPGGGDIEPDCYAGNNQHPTVRDVDPGRDWAEMVLVRQAIEQDKPMLAICRGLQMFNVALGGSLWEDVHSQMPGAMVHDYYHRGTRDHLAHAVCIEPDSRLASIVKQEQISVNSLHHQGIRQLAPSLRAVGRAPDGLIEAIEYPDRKFALGLQWHPENLLGNVPAMLNVFQEFVGVAGSGR